MRAINIHMKKQSRLIKKITVLFAAIALLGVGFPAAHARLIIAADFPINGVNASEIPTRAIRTFLLAAYDKDICA